MLITRDTLRKRAILQMLEEDYYNADRDSPVSGYGKPPFNATTIARYVDLFGGANGKPEIAPECGDWDAPESTVRSFARTLRGMAKEGLIVQVRQKIQVRNAIARDVVDMPQTCYYSPKTMAANIEAEDAERARRAWYRDTPEGRAAQDAQLDAFARFLVGAKAPAQTTAAQLPDNVLDGCISEVWP